MELIDTLAEIGKQLRIRNQIDFIRCITAGDLPVSRLSREFTIKSLNELENIIKELFGEECVKKRTTEEE